MITILAGMACSVGLLVGTAGTSGAQGVASVTFGSPTGISCSGTETQSMVAGHPVGAGHYVNVPFDSWNGKFLALTKEFPKMYPVPGPNCGDVTHGSKADAYKMTASGSYADTANTYGLDASATEMRAPSTTAYDVAVAKNTQEIDGSGMVPIASGDNAFTFSVTYTNTATTNGAAGQGSIQLNFEVGGPEPSCSAGGSWVLSFDGYAYGIGSPGTYTLSETWSCPTGQTIVAGPFSVQVQQVQTAVAATDVDSSEVSAFTTEIDSATLSAS